MAIIKKVVRLCRIMGMASIISLCCVFMQLQCVNARCVLFNELVMTTKCYMREICIIDEVPLLISFELQIPLR